MGLMGIKEKIELLQVVKKRLDAVEVMGWYGISLKQQGKSDNFMGRCPFHSDRNPSLSVSRTKKLFHCFGCGAGGDILAFIKLIDKVSFLEALLKLAQRYGITIQKLGGE